MENTESPWILCMNATWHILMCICTYIHTCTHMHESSQVLFHTAGIVMLTLLVNATTVKYLLKALGMSDISNATRVTMSQGRGNS